jgi:hypothetical protein
MFLFMVILSPNSLGRNMDVCLQLLIDELTQLWSSRALTYDVLTKQNFLIKTTLMWTVNDFPTYEMVSGWSTHGKLACPYCMKNNKLFTLTNSGKMPFFYCHQRFLLTDHMYIKNIKNFFFVELKRMLHPRVFLIKNCIAWCQSTVTLCLVFNPISRSILVLV